MKKSSDEIFRLIKSMTRSEKRYFQIYAGRHVQGDKNNYLELYEIINNLEVYDEDMVKQRLSSEKVINYLPAAKYYLFNLVLDSLHSFNENNSTDAILRKKLHHVEILLQKGLIDQCRKLLVKLRQKAYDHERFHLVVEISGIEKSLMARAYYKDVTEDQLLKIHEEEKEVLEKLANVNDYWLLHGKVYLHHFSKGSLRKQKDAEMLNEIASNELLQDKSKARSFRALMDFLHTNAIYCFASGKVEEAYNYNREFLELFESEPEKIADHPKRYMSVLNNYLVDSLNLGQHEELKKGIKKLRHLGETEVFRQIENANADIFRLSGILELNAFIDTGNFKGGLEALPDIIDKLKVYEPLIVKHNVITICYLISYIYFGSGNYKEALKWVNRILNDTSDNLMQDVYSFARLLHLIIHYELKNFDVLEYALKTSKRYLKQRERLFAVEKLLLEFLHKQSGITGQKALLDLCHNYKSQLLPLQGDPFESRAFQYFDFISWFNSKINNKSFADTVMEQQGMKVGA